ncbi:hypothetical protein [Leptospira licerasiae]|uniref:hypothetical protein n=1 Tax=Leptospira licerasiae TaxID=447106 RepID=UPI001082E0CD|nr:hypothetical protein [Leptospira licerasiae]TGM87944.1 hypothetical protein EHR05_14945 [Leptospira licerasiae]
MLEQIISQHLFQLTQNGVLHRGLSEEEAISIAEQTVTAIAKKSKDLASNIENPNINLLFQQISQLTIGKILGGADPLKSVEESANSIKKILLKSKIITTESGLQDY